jgi:hypothetical protein
MNVGEVFLGAFLGFIASYAVEKLLSWEADKSRAKTALQWVRRELSDNMGILKSCLAAPHDELNHTLYPDHHWNSAILSGALTSLREHDVLADLSTVYRELKDIERWTGLLCEVYFNTTDAQRREVPRISKYIRSRQEKAVDRIQKLIENPSIRCA